MLTMPICRGRFTLEQNLIISKSIFSHFENISHVLQILKKANQISEFPKISILISDSKKNTIENNIQFFILRFYKIRGDTLFMIQNNCSTTNHHFLKEVFHEEKQKQKTPKHYQISVTRKHILFQDF